MSINSKYIAAVPLIGVNAVAIYGQYGYLHDHLTWPNLPIVGLAITIESIAVYLAYMAHKSLIALDTALRLRLAAYGFGILAGFMNLSHYSPNWHVTSAGIITGTLSASSPWLWGVYSRRQSRDILAEKGLIEPGAVKLGNRWVVHPIWCIPVYRFAVWQGIRSPSQAIDEYSESKPEPTSEPMSEPETITPEITEAVIAAIEPSVIPAIETAPEPEPQRITEPESERITEPHIRTKADAVRAAYVALGANTASSDVVKYAADRGFAVTPAYARTIRSQDKAKGTHAALRSVPGAKS